MESILYQVIKHLSKEFPNDMELGNKVRRIIREINGEVDNEILSKTLGKMEKEMDEEKLSPTEDDITKLESFLSNLKSKENGVQ